LSAARRVSCPSNNNFYIQAWNGGSSGSMRPLVLEHVARWYPVAEIAEMLVDAPVWLIPVYDDSGEVFQARMPVFVDILHDSHLDEFVLVPPDLSWLLMVNHHNCLYGVGARVEPHLARIKRRAGGNGAVVKNYPPEEDRELSGLSAAESRKQFWCHPPAFRRAIPA
jgi:hypothetical protein